MLRELYLIPGECSLKLKYQREDFLSWGEKVQRVEQKRCDGQVLQAQYEAEGVPWWGVVLGVSGGAALGLMLGILFGFVGAQ